MIRRKEGGALGGLSETGKPSKPKNRKKNHSKLKNSRE